MDPVDLVNDLDRRINRCRKRLLRNDAYYEGEQPLKYMAPALEAELGDRIAQLIINWPRMCVDAYENRLDIEGFRFAREDAGDDRLWDMFNENDGVHKYQQGHIEFLVCGRFYAIVGSPEVEGDVPVLTVEHPLQMTAIRDPKTRQLTSALKRWKEDDGSQWANLYLPNSTTTFTKSLGRWVVAEDDVHDVGRLLVTEFVNRGRMLRGDGVSEFHDVLPVADAANKMATDMMISGEFHAMPRRWAMGFTKEDFQDEHGNPVSAWSIIAGRIWSSGKKPTEAQLGQFAETDLKVFHDTIKVLAQLAAQLMYLPQDYMSFTSDNPTSADAMRASESRMIKRSERMQQTLTVGWKKVQQDMIRIADGKFDEKAKTLEVLWRDAATPTVAQKADATVKLTQGTNPIIDIEQAWEDLGYSEGAQKRMTERKAARASDNLIAGVAQFFRTDPATGKEIPTGNAAA